MSTEKKKAVVIYASQYGTTERYARWIADALGAPIFEAQSIDPARMMEYDVVIYGGGLYAGGIAGAKLVAKHPSKALVLFTVGLATPATTDYSAILARHFTKAQLAGMQVFHLRGGIDYGGLGPIHRAMMAFMKSRIMKIPPDARTSDDRQLLETYGAKVDFTDQAAINPLVDAVRAL